MRTLLVVVLVSAAGAAAFPGAGTSSATPPAGARARTAPALVPQSPSPSLQVEEHVLENGFTILLVEDHRAPRVAANLWIRVGSMQEAVGLHGITHFLEQVIHQGTTTIGTSDLAAELPILREIHDTEQELIAARNRARNQLRERDVFYDELGWPSTPGMRALRTRLYELEDRDNEYRDFWTSCKWYMEHGGYVRHMDPVPASTEQDYMEMNMALPREHLELFFRLEADRMVNAVFRGWEAQRFTVLEQILGGKSRPQTRFNEAIDGINSQGHPARAALVLGALGGCGGGSDDTLPGRSRPMLDHDWPDPGEFALGPAAFTPPDPQEALYEASSGARAYIVAGAPTDPLVRLTAALPLGRLHEGDGEAGASALLIQLVTTRGPAGASNPLTLRLAELGTSLGTVETLDAIHLSLSVLPEDWREALELLVELVRDPDLDAGTIRAYRAGSGYTMPMAGIDGDGFRPKVELERRVHGYPPAPPDPGTLVSPEAMRALASRSLAADRVIFGVGGPVSRSEVEEVLEAATRGWRRTGGPVSEPAVIEPAPTATNSGRSAIRLHTVDVPSLEGWIAIGHAVDAVPETDRAALAVLRFILAERLNIAAREMRGLANRDHFEVPGTGSGTGLLLVRTGGRPEAVAPLVRYSLDELEQMHDPDTPVTEAEVTRAQGWLVNAVWRRSLELATSASGTFAVEHVRRGSADYLMGWPAMVLAVTADDVKAIAQEYLDPTTFVTVVAGPLDRIRAARHPRWPVALDEVEAELGRP